MDTEPTTDIVPAPTTASLAPLRGSAIVTPAVQAAQAVEAQEAYHELCRALLDDSDVQRIGDKDFRKKSAWRKLAVAFNVSNEIVSREYERDGHGRIVRAEVIDRATAPNGRTMDGLGACDLFEKCCVKATCRVRSQYHTHCDEKTGGCDGTRHFSNPQHDIPATAATRARNRSCADLFGMGEVSAEEITNPERGEYGGRGRSDEADQRSWYEKNGWDEEAEERQVHSALIERLKGLDDDAKRKFGDQRRERGIALDKPLTRDEYDALVAMADAVEAPDAPEPAQDAPGASTDDEGGDSPGEAQETPQEGTQDEGQPSERVEAMHRAQQITEHVKGMKLQDVDNALSDHEQATDGPANDRRKRLAVYLVEHPDIELPA